MEPKAFANCFIYPLKQNCSMALTDFLEPRKLVLLEKISKGYSSEIFLVRNARGKLFALKVEKAKSTRINMAKREAENLLLANSVGVGPKLIGFSVEESCILMEFIAGKRFCDWIETVRSKRALEKFLEQVFKQLRVLDALGLDHGQLGGSAKNILVRKKTNKPVIIDFEKASTARKTHNLRQFLGEFFFNRRSRIRARMAGLFGSGQKLLDFAAKNK